MVQKLHICEKVYFDQLLDFQILLLLFRHTLLLCHMLDFFNTIQVSNSLDPDQVQHFVGPDLGPTCLKGLSADDKMFGWIWIQTVCKGYKPTTKVGKELNTKLEDLKVLRRSPDLLNNVTIGQGQLQLILEQILFSHISGLQTFWSSDLNNLMNNPSNSPVISEKQMFR